MAQLSAQARLARRNGNPIEGKDGPEPGTAPGRIGGIAAGLLKCIEKVSYKIVRERDDDKRRALLKELVLLRENWQVFHGWGSPAPVKVRPAAARTVLEPVRPELEPIPLPAVVEPAPEPPQV